MHVSIFQKNNVSYRRTQYLSYSTRNANAFTWDTNQISRFSMFLLDICEALIRLPNEPLPSIFWRCKKKEGLVLVFQWRNTRSYHKRKAILQIACFIHLWTKVNETCTYQYIHILIYKERKLSLNFARQYQINSIYL